MNRYRETTIKTKMFLSFQPKLEQQVKTLCQHCQSNNEMLSVIKAALIVGCNSLAILGWCRLGWLHFTENKDGVIFICQNSLDEITKLWK